MSAWPADLYYARHLACVSRPFGILPGLNIFHLLTYAGWSGRRLGPTIPCRRWAAKYYKDHDWGFRSFCGLFRYEHVIQHHPTAVLSAGVCTLYTIVRRMICCFEQRTPSASMEPLRHFIAPRSASMNLSAPRICIFTNFGKRYHTLDDHWNLDSAICTTIRKFIMTYALFLAPIAIAVVFSLI